MPVLTKDHVMTRLTPSLDPTVRTSVPHNTDPECKESPLYEVDEVVDHRHKSEDIKYRVRRYVFSNEEHTCEPASHTKRQLIS